MSERNFMGEMTCLQGKEVELLLWVHIAFIVLAWLICSCLVV